MAGMSKIRDVVTVLGMVDRGHLIREANEKFEQVLTELNDQSIESPKKKLKGKVTITLDIMVENGIATVTAEATNKLPKRPPGAAIFWTTQDGALTTQHPQQNDMFIREAAAGEG